MSLGIEQLPPDLIASIQRLERERLADLIEKRADVFYEYHLTPVQIHRNIANWLRGSP